MAPTNSEERPNLKASVSTVASTAIAKRTAGARPRHRPNRLQIRDIPKRHSPKVRQKNMPRFTQLLARCLMMATRNMMVIPVGVTTVTLKGPNPTGGCQISLPATKTSIQQLVTVFMTFDQFGARWNIPQLKPLTSCPCPTTH